MQTIQLTSQINNQPIIVIAEHITHVEMARGDQADVYLSSGALVRVTESQEQVQAMLKPEYEIKPITPPSNPPQDAGQTATGRRERK